MKLNNKGLTLAELIVSFMLVGVAIVYFFQTLTTVNKLYATAREETNDFIERDYALRIADAWADTKTTLTIGNETIAGYKFSVRSMRNNIYRIVITKGTETITYLYKYIVSN